jgi:hypothetical protein
MAQNQKTFAHTEKDLDCFSAVLNLIEFDKIEQPTTQQELKLILENEKNFELVTRLSDIQPDDIVVFLEKLDGLNPYKHAYVVKNSKRETVLTRPIKGQKVTLTNLPLELKKKKTAHFKTIVYREILDENDKPMFRSNSSTRNNSRNNDKNKKRLERQKYLEEKELEKQKLNESEVDDENEDDMVFIEEN